MGQITEARTYLSPFFRFFYDTMFTIFFEDVVRISGTIIIRNRCNFHPVRNENCSGFCFAALTVRMKIVRAALRVIPMNTQQSVFHGYNPSDCA